MANSLHIEWLKEGVEAWNKRRKQEPFTPELEDIVFSVKMGDMKNSDGTICLDGINLAGADLSGANLFHVSLQDSDLTQADLTEAQLFNVKLDRAECILADFSGANLWHATLNHTEFDGAILRGADLSGCKLSGASLYDTDLTGTDLTASEIWEAEIFPPKRSQRYQPINAEGYSEEKISSVSEFLKAFKTIKRVYADYPQGLPDTEKESFKIEAPAFYFRGHRCKSWNLRPSVMRSDKLREAEEDMLLDIMTQQPNAFKGLDSALAEWVLAQHHGLKTRLLDVTRNPLVALFYACEDTNLDHHNDEEAQVHIFAVGKSLIKTFRSDTISVIANFAKLSQGEKAALLGRTRQAGETSLEYKDILGKLYYHIHREKPYFHERINPRDFFKVFVIEPQQSFDRIRVQSGAFLISGFHERFEREEILGWNSDTPVYDHYMLTIPHTDKKSILDELQLLGIARENLFPGLDEAARSIIQRYST